MILGTNIFTGEPVHYFPKHSGREGIVILAKPGYGKSCVARILYTQMQEGRKIFIFDYASEHTSSRWINMRARHLRKGLRNSAVFKAEDISFYLSDFTQKSDWFSLGFAASNARLAWMCANSKKWQKLHEDEPKKLLKVLSSFPTDPRLITRFNHKFNAHLGPNDWQNRESLNAMKSRMEELVEHGVIGWPGDGKRHITAWTDVLRRYNVILNLQLSMSEIHVSKARAWVAVIIRQFTRHPGLMMHLKPMFIFEEADKLVPHPGEYSGQMEPGSSRAIKDLIAKQGKWHVGVMLLSQNDSMLDPATIRNSRTLVLGQLEGGTLAPLTQKLRWNSNLGFTGYRQFLLRDEGRATVFEPIDSPCADARYPIDNQDWLPQSLLTRSPIDALG